MKHWAKASNLARPVPGRASADAEELWRQAFVLEVTPGGDYGSRDGAPSALARPGQHGSCDIFLGVFGGRAWFARVVEKITSGTPTSWRDTEPRWFHPVAAGVAFARWHGQQPACEACGTTTVPDGLGARRRCPQCGQLAFPRQDPAVIVAVLDPHGRLLLARQAGRPPGRVSVVAGFVEAGESLEQACWREVAEEVGVVVESVAYVGSQPWPMPRSLMAGFVAAAPDTEIVPDGHEIVEGRYWSRDEVEASLAAGTVTLPQGASIARALIDQWRDGTLRRP